MQVKCGIAYPDFLINAHLSISVKEFVFQLLLVTPSPATRVMRLFTKIYAQTLVAH